MMLARTEEDLLNTRGHLIRAAVSIALVGAAGCSAATAGSGVPGPAATVPASPSASASGPAPKGQSTGRYLVFYAEGKREAALKAVQDAGGELDGGDERLGYLIARIGDPERVGADPSVVGVTPDRPIGMASSALAARRAPAPAPAGHRPGVLPSGGQGPVKPEPLAHLQWDMEMIGATATGSYAKARGKRSVLVGVIDTGIDATHPDIAPNFNKELSRSFLPAGVSSAADGHRGKDCGRTGCAEYAGVDGEGHGTHVASTIGSPINGLGIAGVAPDVSLVDLRAGTDEGLFFLKPTMDALAYAADVGIDVVNMSFFVDPWQFNCTDNPEDSPAERLDQRGIIEGMRRAVDYARRHGVTLITAIGNTGIDLGRPERDGMSPNYPKGAAKVRRIDNSCITVPTELDGVISVTAVGPSGNKAGYSDYGLEQADIAAPGGDLFDTASPIVGVRRGILAATPESVLRAARRIDDKGNPRDASVVRDCRGGTCAYYRYLEGTSMAAPHVTGVAAIIIGRFGVPGKGGLAMDPAEVERLLYASAVPKACPAQGGSGSGARASQVCEGGKRRNGFFGHGIVNAAQAAVIEP